MIIDTSLGFRRARSRTDSRTASKPNRSAAADTKASTQHDTAGTPLRSFRGLLDHLATLLATLFVSVAVPGFFGVGKGHGTRHPDEAARPPVRLLPGRERPHATPGDVARDELARRTCRALSANRCAEILNESWQLVRQCNGLIRAFLRWRGPLDNPKSRKARGEPWPALPFRSARYR